MRPRPRFRATAAACPRAALPMLLVLAVAAPGHTQAADPWTVSGDLRMAYVASEGRARDGTESDADSLRARLRLRLRGELGRGWHAGGGVATRLDSEQDGTEFWMRPYAPGPSGLEDGQATIDEAYLEYRPADARWNLRLGRFQAAWGLADVMKKSLDQNDSSSFDITWTDGAWLQWQAGDDWTAHLLLRHNDRRGPTGALRPPLAFDDGDSRVGVLAVAESTTALGPLVQRVLTVNWLPSALHPYGVGDPRTRDYVALTAKATAQWPLGDGGTRLRLGGELGYAPDTPRREAVGSGTGQAGSVSWQASFNLMDIVPRHDVGIVYGRVTDGWLVSSDFRPNDSLLEARWVWRASQAWQIDARIRRRKELDLPAAAPGARRDDDLHLRATWKF